MAETHIGTQSLSRGRTCPGPTVEVGAKRDDLEHQGRGTAGYVPQDIGVGQPLTPAAL